MFKTEKKYKIAYAAYLQNYKIRFLKDDVIHCRKAEPQIEPMGQSNY